MKIVAVFLVGALAIAIMDALVGYDPMPVPGYIHSVACIIYGGVTWEIICRDREPKQP